jgi:hypothetical protein
MFGHLAIIQASALIKELNILVTADDIGTIKSWDLDTYRAVQSIKLKGNKNVFSIVSLGNWGFVVFTSNLNFFKFEDGTN